MWRPGPHGTSSSRHRSKSPAGAATNHQQPAERDSSSPWLGTATGSALLQRLPGAGFLKPLFPPQAASRATGLAYPSRADNSFFQPRRSSNPQHPTPQAGTETRARLKDPTPSTNHQPARGQSGAEKELTASTGRPSRVTFGPADFYEVHHVLVFEQLQDFNLSQGRDGELERRKRGQGLGVQGPAHSCPENKGDVTVASWAGDLLEQHFNSSLRDNQSKSIQHQDCQNLFLVGEGCSAHEKSPPSPVPPQLLHHCAARRLCSQEVTAGCAPWLGNHETSHYPSTDRRGEGLQGCGPGHRFTIW